MGLLRWGFAAISHVFSAFGDSLARKGFDEFRLVFSKTWGALIRTLPFRGGGECLLQVRLHHLNNFIGCGHLLRCGLLFCVKYVTPDVSL
jgi:hypothetical protein